MEGKGDGEGLVLSTWKTEPADGEKVPGCGKRKKESKKGKAKKAVSQHQIGGLFLENENYSPSRCGHLGFGMQLWGEKKKNGPCAVQKKTTGGETGSERGNKRLSDDNDGKQQRRGNKPDFAKKNKSCGRTGF